MAFANAEGIPFVDLPAVMDHKADSGYLWWDFAHLSDAGAAIVADAVAPALQELIQPRLQALEGNRGKR